MHNDIFEKTFNEEMSKNEQDANSVKEALSKASLEFVKTFPVWMRCNYLLNQISVMSDKEKQNIKWDLINEILNYQNDNFDFNYFDTIDSVDKLLELRGLATTAEIQEFNEPYLKRKCKQCGEEFTLTRGEIDSYLNKSLKVPCRCYYCRKNIEKPKPIIKKEEKEEPVKTAMEIALEKAGLLAGGK